MPRKHPRQQEILIVGAGPAGLFAAIQLARHGVMPRVVEQRLLPHRQARATAIQPAGLELLARAGVLAPFMESAVRVRRTRFFGPGRTEMGVSNFSRICCPYEYQCSLPQWQTESILLAYFHGLGGAVERGTKVISVDNDADWLNVRLKRTDGNIETMLAHYVLGLVSSLAQLKMAALTSTLQLNMSLLARAGANLCAFVASEPRSSTEDMMTLKDDFSPFAQPGFLVALAVILVVLGAVAGAFWWLTSS